MVAVDSFRAKGGPCGGEKVPRELVWFTNPNGLHDRGRLHGDHEYVHRHESLEVRVPADAPKRNGHSKRDRHSKALVFSGAG